MRESLSTPASASNAFTLAGWTQTIKRSALQELLVIASRPEILSFALGLPAAELFPVRQFMEATEQALFADTRALQYGPPFPMLKQHIVELMKQRGVACRKEQIFLTAGAQQGLNLLTHLLLEPRGQVISEEMIYPGFKQVVDLFQPEILTVGTDLRDGIDVMAVESLLRGGARPAFIYAISDGHNPLGVSISQVKRERLVELANSFSVPIIEEDPYGFLSYDSNIPPMRALDERWVFYVGSFSKILAPALRLGWLILPEELISKLSVVKEASDIDTQTFAQRVVSSFFDMGCLPQHLAALRDEYRVRRDTMLAAVERHFPPGTICTKPPSGVFLWVELPADICAEELLRIAIETEQVAFLPGNAFCLTRQPQASHSIRLNFSNCRPELIEEGIRRLTRAMELLRVQALCVAG